MKRRLLTVEELIQELESMPQDAYVAVPTAGSFTESTVRNVWYDESDEQVHLE